MSLRSSMPFIGGVTIFLGLVIYASPNPRDQAIGTALIGYGAVLFATVLLPSDRRTEVVRLVLTLPVLLFLGYCVLRK